MFFTTLLKKYRLLRNKRKLIAVSEVQEFIDCYARDDNWHELDREKGNLGYGWWHYGLIRMNRPKRILVIGSRYGFIPAVCALACRDNKEGVVDFVDAGFDQDNPEDRDRHWGGMGVWKTIDPKAYFGKFELDRYLRLHVMTTAQFVKKFPKRTWQYVYVDGDHSYQGVKGDFRRFWPKVASGGFMSFHDVAFTPSKEDTFDYGVQQLWKEVIKKNPHAIALPGKCGLGIVQKTKK